MKRLMTNACPTIVFVARGAPLENTGIESSVLGAISLEDFPDTLTDGDHFTRQQASESCTGWRTCRQNAYESSPSISSLPHKISGCSPERR